LVHMGLNPLALHSPFSAQRRGLLEGHGLEVDRATVECIRQSHVCSVICTPALV
jgi:hypothetical protein